MPILCIDIGNTNVKFGVYDGGVLLTSFRFASNVTKTSDEYGVNVRNGFVSDGLNPHSITGIVTSSVIPSLNYTFDHMCRNVFGIKPLVVSAKNAGIEICYETPTELGSDRIATSVAAHKKYPGGVIVIDFGTATTFNCIDADGRFLGGMIFAGMRSASDALVSATAKLPRFELVVPERAIGTNTVENLQAGMYYGFVGAVERCVERLKSDPRLHRAKVIATGGLAELIAGETDLFDGIDRELSLFGLYLIYGLNNRDKETV